MSEVTITEPMQDAAPDCAEIKAQIDGLTHELALLKAQVDSLPPPDTAEISRGIYRINELANQAEEAVKALQTFDPSSVLDASAVAEKLWDRKSSELVRYMRPMITDALHTADVADAIKEFKSGLDSVIQQAIKQSLETKIAETAQAFARVSVQQAMNDESVIAGLTPHLRLAAARFSEQAISLIDKKIEEIEQDAKAGRAFSQISDALDKLQEFEHSRAATRPPATEGSARP